MIRVKRQFQRSQSQEDYEEFGFLFPGRQLPGTFDRNSNQRAISQTSTTAMNPSPVTNSRAVDACVRGCSVRTTNQYNPVCGSDGQFYTNRARLDCTIDCGASEFFSIIALHNFLMREFFIFRCEIRQNWNMSAGQPVIHHKLAV